MMFARSVLVVAVVLRAASGLCALRDDDQVLARAYIPTADNVHGETRLVRRGDSACVQTVLHSPSLRRGVREIGLREADVWARPHPGVEDSLKYREELEKAKQAVVSARPESEAPGEPYTMLMEFTFKSGQCTVGFFHADVERTDDTFAVKSATPISTLPVSDSYMSRAMRIMTAAAFSLHGEQLGRLLESAGWVDLSPDMDIQSPIPLR